ncbi:MAG: enoyl-CoA hydratase/isomerase family protein [Proteobacteria bacterium]|nr:enoyl-CoA hydratase/isomerase family protein [Pseudomonadota bacterium]
MASIEWKVEGAVRTVTLNRPEKRNALDGAMMEELKAAFTAPPAATERVAVIRANGPVFCAGLDMRWRANNPQGESGIEKMLHAVEVYPLPVVAVVHGDAIAGGNELALHCDIVVASKAARFGMSLAQVGLAPSWFLAKKLLEVAGPVITKKILLLGDPLGAEEFHKLGLISHLAEPADLEKTASTIIQRLADNAPLSLKAMKALINREMQFRDGIPHEDIDLIVDKARTSQDAQEGMKARLEKRKPAFKSV